MGNILGERQQRAVASGITALAVALLVAFVAFVVWISVKALSSVSAAITPVIIGLFLAMFFKPYYHWWLKRVKNPTVAVALMSLSILIPLGFGFWYFGSFVVDQVTNLINQAPAISAKLQDWFHTTFPKVRELATTLGLPYENWLAVSKAKVIAFVAGSLRYLNGAVSWLVGLVFFVLFLTRPDVRGRDCVKELAFLKPDTRVFIAEQIDAFTAILVDFFRRQTAICLIEGCYYGLGFALVGLNYGFLLGFVLGVMNLVPFLGSVVCLPAALALGYFGAGGGTFTVCAVAGVWLLGQFLDGYVITPRIQGQGTGLGYGGVIFSFLFWFAVFNSILGLLLAIPLSAFCVVLWRAIKARYFKAEE